MRMVTGSSVLSAVASVEAAVEVLSAAVLSAVLEAEPPQAAREPAIMTAIAALIMRLFFIWIFLLQFWGLRFVGPLRCLYDTRFLSV